MPPVYRKRLGTRLKKTARGAKRIAGKIAKTGYKAYSKVRDYQNASALAMAGMRLLNVEKKRVDVSQGVGVAFGLNNGISNGFYAVDITPTPAQGVTGSTRNGNSVKLVSACIDLQIKQDTNTVNTFRYKWMIVTRPDASQTLSASNALSSFYEANPFTGFVDYHSNRDPEYFHQFRVIKTGRGQLSSDQLATQTSFNQIKIPLKLKHHLKFNADASTVTTKNQFYLFIVSDTGSVTAATGALAYYNCRYYYVDN